MRRAAVRCLTDGRVRFSRLVNALPDRGERLRKAVIDMERFLAQPSTPMDCDVLTDRFQQMTMPSTEKEVHLEKPVQSPSPSKADGDFGEERLNEVKQRLKAHQAERQSKATVTAAKLISLQEAVRLYDEERQATEVSIHFLASDCDALRFPGESDSANHRSPARQHESFPNDIWPSTDDLGQQSDVRAVDDFRSPRARCLCRYRRTAREAEYDDEGGEGAPIDEFGRGHAEIDSDHDSDELDYPDEQRNEDADD